MVEIWFKDENVSNRIAADMEMLYCPITAYQLLLVNADGDKNF